MRQAIFDGRLVATITAPCVMADAVTGVVISVNWFAFLFTDEVCCYSGHLAAFVKWMFRAARTVHSSRLFGSSAPAPGAGLHARPLPIVTEIVFCLSLS